MYGLFTKCVVGLYWGDKMAFIAQGEDNSSNNKQHLNLSPLAYEVILGDMFTFGDEKISGFINTVFEHFSPIAEASIAQTLNRFNGELSKSISDISGDEKTKKRVLESLILQKSTALLRRLRHMKADELLSFGSIRKTWNTCLNQVRNVVKNDTTQNGGNTSNVFLKNTHDCPTLNGKRSILAH